MVTRELSIRIAYLYPRYLNIYGNGGNILALKKRCLWRGISADVVDIDIDERIDISDFDIIFVGGRLNQKLQYVAQKIIAYKNWFQEESNNGRVFFGVDGGYQLFGKYFTLENKEKVEGLGILDIYTEFGQCNFVGNVFGNSSIIPSGKIIGFENHNTLTYLETGTIPMGTVVNGFGNNGKDKTEGAVKNNVFGTYLHGAFLPKNPEFADFLITKALEQKYNNNIVLTPLDDEIEKKLQLLLCDEKFERR